MTKQSVAFSISRTANNSFGSQFGSNDVYYPSPSVVENTNSHATQKGWKGLIAAKADATLDYTRTSYNVKAIPGSGKMSARYLPFNSTDNHSVSGSILRTSEWPSLGPNDDFLKLDAEVATSFLSKVYKAQTTFQGGVFLGELREVVNLVKHPLSGVTKELKKYVHRISKMKRGKGKASLHSVNRAVSGAYLEAMFAVRPLLSDVDDAAHAAANYLNYRSPVKHVFARGDRNWNIGESSHYSSLDLFGSWFQNYRLIRKATCSVTYSGAVAIPIGYKGDLADVGLGFRNFVPTIYQLLPYSFLLDYFSNVGSVIEGFCAGQANCIYVVRSVKSTGTITALAESVVNNLKASPAWDVTNETLDAGTLELEKFVFTRNKIAAGSLRPSVSWGHPGLFSLKSLNIGALFAQAFSAQR